MYKKVMVAIGNDETSPFALQEALNIVSRDGAKLCIVHAVAEAEDGETKKNEQGAESAGAGHVSREGRSGGGNPFVGRRGRVRLEQHRGSYRWRRSRMEG